MIVNTTPHPITFRGADGNDFTVAPHEVVTATAVEAPAGEFNGVALVRATFVANAQGEAVLARLERLHPGAIIVGSIIAAQAFPGRVFAMIPAPGFERVAPAEKRMNPDKFTTF